MAFDKRYPPDVLRKLYTSLQKVLFIGSSASLLALIIFLWIGGLNLKHSGPFLIQNVHLSMHIEENVDIVPPEFFYSYLGNNLSTSIFLVIDSAYFKSDVISGVKKWAEDEPFIRDCSISSSCNVHIIFYQDDNKTVNSTLGESLHKIFDPEYSTVAAKDKVHYIANRTEDARTINDIMMKSYTTGVDYFLLITSEQIAYEGRTGRTMQELIDVVSDLNLRDIGNLLFTKPLSSYPYSTLTGCLFSKLHLEIFGEPFPYFYIQKLSVGLEFLLNVYPKFMKFSLSLESSRVSQAEMHSPTSPLLTTEFMNNCKDTLTRYVKAVEASESCLRCGINKNNKVIAMSLFGSDPRYTYGAIRNAQQLPVTFPGWRLWFYTEKEPKEGIKRQTPPVPAEIVQLIEELGAEFRYIDAAVTGPRLWRFTILEEMDIEVFIIRDSDSRLTPRDSAVVAEWLKTDKPFHCARDHPSHSWYAISAGLWGGKPKQLREIFNGSLLSSMKQYGADFFADTNFMQKYLWPKVKDNYAICHDSFSCKRYQASVPFPVARIGYEHLGQVYDEHHIGRASDIDVLKNVELINECTPAA